jgi:hypothetical protein
MAFETTLVDPIACLAGNDIALQSHLNVDVA